MPSNLSTMKYAYQSTVYDYNLPEDNQIICKIITSLGNNTFMVQSQEDKEFIVSLVTKFRNNIMLIPGHFVITEVIPEGKKVKAEIVRILTPKQIKHFHSEKIWPEIFSDTIHLGNTYDNEKEKEKNLDHLKNTISARRPLCSASLQFQAGSSSKDVGSEVAEDDSCSSDEDDMPYIEPNHNLKGVSKIVSMADTEESSSDEEDSESEEEGCECEEENCGCEEVNGECEEEDGECENETNGDCDDETKTSEDNVKSIVKAVKKTEL